MGLKGFAQRIGHGLEAEHRDASRPSWARGSKHPNAIHALNHFEFAPFTGASQRIVCREETPTRSDCRISICTRVMMRTREVDTATFAKQNGIFYVCTCRHILESIRNSKMVAGREVPDVSANDRQHAR